MSNRQSEVSTTPDLFASEQTPAPVEPSPLCLTPGESIIANVLVETHPVLHHRVLVTGSLANGSVFESWVVVLRGLVVRAGDRVELYRQLELDPREARRQLASLGRTMREGATGDAQRRGSSS